MPFFRDLRRRTTSFRSNKSGSPDGTNGSSRTNGTNGTNSTVPETRSSSTLNSVYATSTPPSTIQPHASTPNLTNSAPPNGSSLSSRPNPITLSSSRLSVMVDDQLSPNLWNIEGAYTESRVAERRHSMEIAPLEFHLPLLHQS